MPQRQTPDEPIYQLVATVTGHHYRFKRSTVVIFRREFKIEWMLAGFSIARFFCLAGGALALISLVLWVILPVHLVLPPYFFTPILAVGYGIWCWRRTRERLGRKEARE